MRGIILLPFIIGVLLVPKVALAETSQQPVCGYDSCPKSDPNKLNVHLLPYTLNHIGYTVIEDVYYNAYAKYQINSIIDSLVKNPARRFTYVDVNLIWKWWRTHNETKRETLKNLINEGRFEISNGGWGMNDEAVTHYQSIIDHYTWAFRRLNDSFGECARPRVGWQLGSLGHAREQASLLAQMGLDGTYLGHVDNHEKSMRFATKSAELIWDASPSLGNTGSLFTSILNNIETPRPFCYDAHCHGRIPIIDDLADVNYNVRQRATYLMHNFKDAAKKYKTNNINFVLGGTNNYLIAELWYSNYDKIIKYINEKNGTEFNVFYSTLSCYIKSLNEQNVTWPVRDQDFLPYATDHNSYYTGYYTTRPTIKFFERQGNNFLQVIKQLSVLSNQPDSNELQSFREIMATMQNFHAITGSHIMQVGSDYFKKMLASMKNASHIASRALNKLITKKEVPHPLKFHSCRLLNTSVCKHTSENKKFVVMVYNPTSQPLTTFIRLPVQIGSYEVKDQTGKQVLTQMVPIPEAVLKIPGRVSNATLELIFQTDKIPALGYESFYVQQTSDEAQNVQPANVNRLGGENVSFGVNSHGRIFINAIHGLKLQQSFHYYESAKADNAILNRVSSGVIIFRPKYSQTKVLSGNVSYQIYKGPLVEEIHQVINDWTSQVIRYYSDLDLFEFDWLIGPIPIEDRVSKEIVTKYSSNLKNHHGFYTDSNGRGTIKRKLKNWLHGKMRIAEPVAANYYPVTTKIAIEDKHEKRRMAVLVDRAEGGSSLSEGEIELMLHRRITSVDYSGVPANEVAHGTGIVVRGQHYLLLRNLTDRDNVMLMEKERAVELHTRPWLFFTPANESFEEWRENYKMKSDRVVNSLPRNVRILTLEPWKDGEILLRLEHLFEANETRSYSVPVDVNLKDLFNDFTVVSVHETTLGANQWMKDAHRLKWQPEAAVHVPITEHHLAKRSLAEYSAIEYTTAEIPQQTAAPFDDQFIVRLRPMEIRTFILEIAHGVKSTLIPSTTMAMSSMPTTETITTISTMTTTAATAAA